MDKKKIRNSNIELLRIISMVLILIHHYSVHSNVIFPPGKYMPQKYL